MPQQMKCHNRRNIITDKLQKKTNNITKNVNITKDEKSQYMRFREKLNVTKHQMSQKLGVTKPKCQKR